MPTTASPYDDPNPYHPAWIRSYDFHDPLENKEDVQDHERLEGVCLEKEYLYTVEIVDKHFIRMDFAPIRQNDTWCPCIDNPPFAVYYAAEAKRQVMSEKQQHEANINLVEGHKHNQFYGYYKYRQLISEIMVLYQDINNHVNTNGIVTNIESMRILKVLDSVRGEIESSPGVDPSSFLFLDAYYKYSVL